MRAATKANSGPLKLARMRGERRSGARKRPGKGRCSRIGRGQTAADRLKRMAAERWPAERMRRVVVKARIVRLKVGSRVADAHVRYLQIVLQKSFCTGVQKFCGPLVRLSCKDAGDLIATR